MVGRTDVLQVSERAKEHWKAKHLDLSVLYYINQKEFGHLKHLKIIKLMNHSICENCYRKLQQAIENESKV